MELRSTLKMALGFFGILLSVGILQAQSAAPKSVPYEGGDQEKATWIENHPEAYQKMGGQVALPAIENQKFSTEAEKAAWIQDHPADYAKMTNGQNQSKNADAGAPTNRLTEMAAPGASPMPWGAPGNKAAWIAAHPAEYALLTGNTSQIYPWGDDANKAAWIAAHPVEFAAMNRVNTVVKPVSQGSASPQNNQN